ncbi:MAG: hypothetical protein U5R14_09945 [Gemmatimonadota bacterium]|nr:hypothetical protein [Gemmatimonadota bacterium]
MANQETRSRARRKRRGDAGAVKDRPAALRFTRVNAMLAAAGMVSLGVGYWLLSQGSITAAPLLLVLAYVVLLPLAIIR